MAMRLEHRMFENIQIHKNMETSKLQINDCRAAEKVLHDNLSGLDQSVDLSVNII